MKLSFKYRIFFIYFIMALASIFVGYLAFITTKNLQKSSSAIMKENVSSLKAAEELELALLNQKGLVSSYFLDGGINWLRTLEDKKRDFNKWFDNAKNVALTYDEKKILQEIYSLYRKYDNQRNNAIRLYQLGNPEEAKRILLVDMKNSIDSLYAKCEDLILINEILISKAENTSQKNVFQMTIFIWTAIIVTLSLGAIAGFLTSRKINEGLICSAKMASLGQLSANIAHEVRNPLTSIKMRLYTLQSTIAGQPAAKDDFNVINEEIDRLEKTVKNFLDFTRLPIPNLQLNNLGEVLKSVLTLVTPKARSQNIEMQESIDLSIPNIVIDKEQIRLVFLNITLNAIESMPRGGLLEVKTTYANRLEKSRGFLEVHIKDTGKGIDPVLKHKLFEPFVTNKQEGTGLGLFIASRIIKAHKGAIAIHSNLDKGTVVVVRLPV